ncbi:MAG: nucleotidyltransferase family protein [archaeon]|nr:nucleotidyltransferase family protein [archaeon]
MILKREMMKMNDELELIIKTLKSLEREIKKGYKAEIIGIFGSYVRGEERAGSDVDVLVEFESGADLIHFVGLSLFLEEELGLKVDVVPYDAIRIELKETILKETVYL